MRQNLLRSKLFWIAILYFAEGFPAGVFLDIFPVYFRRMGMDLKQIGVISLLGLAWSLKFLWAPAIDYYRHHRLWMLITDLLMGLVMLYFAVQHGFGPGMWIAIALYTLLSATNDIAIDGYTIQYLNKDELGFANGIQLGFYRMGVQAAGLILILRFYLSWPAVFMVAAAVSVLIGLACRLAPQEQNIRPDRGQSLAQEFRNLFLTPWAFGAVLLFALGSLWIINRVTKWSITYPNFWITILLIAALLYTIELIISRSSSADRDKITQEVAQGPMFGALLNMLRRPFMLPVILFVLLFKLPDSAMGFMVKPFWVDAGFTDQEIGLIPISLGLWLSIAGGVVGGWVTDRIGIFRGLWILGLFQALSNLGYALAAAVIPTTVCTILSGQQKAIMYSASGIESFTGGVGTAAFLAFLMSIVRKKNSAAEYAILSSVFALTRSLAGWAGGHGAYTMGYANYFLLTFILALPAYLFLPWVRKMIDKTE